MFSLTTEGLEASPEPKQTLPPVPSPPYPAPVTQLTALEEGLPAGWEIRYDKRHGGRAYGRAYYVDHNTRTTTWRDPRPSASAARSSVPANHAALGLLR